MRTRFDAATHSYFLDGRNLVSNTEVLKGVGLIDTRFYTDDGRDRGTLVHDLIEREEAGVEHELGTMPLEISARIRAYRRFKADMGYRAEVVEAPICHATHGVATKPDSIGRLANGKRILFEVKTGAKTKWHDLQTACQEICVSDSVRARDLVFNPQITFPIPRYGLYLAETGRYRLEPHNGPGDHAAFLGALALYKWLKAEGLEAKSVFKGSQFDLTQMPDKIRPEVSRFNIWLFGNHITIK